MILEIARTRMYDAMKAQDKEKKDFYAFLLDKLMKAAKDKQTSDNPNPTLSDAEELDVVQSLVKQTRDAIRLMKEKIPKMSQPESIAEANEFIAARETELTMYAEFLPKQMTDDDIKISIMAVYKDIYQGAPVNKGVLMKHLMPKVKGKADGKRVAELVNEFLASM